MPWTPPAATRYWLEELSRTGVFPVFSTTSHGLAAEPESDTGFFAATILGLSPAWIGAALTFAVVINALLQIPGGFLADRFKRRNLIVIGSLVGAISMILMPQTNMQIN